jgi:hypothetical protein
MCTQSVGLLAAALERAGIATVCLALLPDVATEIRIPRALGVPFPFGHPLGAGGPALQHRVIAAALDLLLAPGPGPILSSFDPAAATDGR